MPAVNAPEASRRLRTSALLPVLVALLAYLVIGYSAGEPDGAAGDPSWFIKAGQKFLAPDLLPSDPFVATGAGYDGQFNFYLAQDLLLQGDAASRDEAESDHVDNVPYRYQRILLPTLGWLTSFGEPGVLVWSLPLVNLLAVLGATFLLARLLAQRGRSPWLSLVFALSLGVIVGVVNDLSDPLAVSLFAAGVVWWLEARNRLAIAALALCLLSRELYVVPVALIAAYELVRHRRAAWPWLIPVGVLAAWQVVLRIALTADPADGTHAPSPVPLLGAAKKLGSLLRHDVVGAANWEIAFIALLLVAWGTFAVLSVAPLQRLRSSRDLVTRADVVPVVALGSVLLVPFLTLDLWRNIPSYTRYAAPAAAMLVLLWALRRDRATAGLMGGMAVLTAVNPIVALLPASHPAIVTEPPPPAANQGRVDTISTCLNRAGLVTRRTTGAPAHAVVLTVSLHSGTPVRLVVHETDAAAEAEAAATRRYLQIAGQEEAIGIAQGPEAVASYERAKAGFDGAILDRCLR